MNTYCVVLCPRSFENTGSDARVQRFYLKATAADRAVVIASLENPRLRVIGVEPSDLVSRSSHETSAMSEAA